MAFNDYVAKPHFSYFASSSPQYLDDLREQIHNEIDEYVQAGGLITELPPQPAYDFGYYIDVYGED